MNTLIKTAAVAAFGWLCYKFGDFKGSICTAAFAYKDTDEDLREWAVSKHNPLRLNVLAAKAVEKHNNNLVEKVEIQA